VTTLLSAKKSLQWVQGWLMHEKARPTPCLLLNPLLNPLPLLLLLATPLLQLPWEGCQGKGKKACSTPCFNPLLFMLNPLLAAGLVATLGLGV
jgi:hypothetical protein